jgi:chemotaxis signal transduction protein
MADLHHLFVGFGPDGDSFRVPLTDVQEIVHLEGSFAHLDPRLPSLVLRQRTVQVVDVNRWLGKDPAKPRHLIVFEQNRRLHGLPVSRADRAPVGAFRELRLRDTLPADTAS